MGRADREEPETSWLNAENARLRAEIATLKDEKEALQAERAAWQRIRRNTNLRPVDQKVTFEFMQFFASPSDQPGITERKVPIPLIAHRARASARRRSGSSWRSSRPRASSGSGHLPPAPGKVSRAVLAALRISPGAASRCLRQPRRSRP